MNQFYYNFKCNVFINIEDKIKKQLSNLIAQYVVIKSKHVKKIIDVGVLYNSSKKISFNEEEISVE